MKYLLLRWYNTLRVSSISGCCASRPISQSKLVQCSASDCFDPDGSLRRFSAATSKHLAACSLLLVLVALALFSCLRFANLSSASLCFTLEMMFFCYRNAFAILVKNTSVSSDVWLVPFYSIYSFGYWKGIFVHECQVRTCLCRDRRCSRVNLPWESSVSFASLWASSKSFVLLTSL